MNMIILDKDESVLNHFRKLEEEVDELKTELMLKDLKNEDNDNHIKEECLDVIQVCLGILDKYKVTEKDILRHVEKLEKRRWKAKKVIKLEVM